MRDESMDAYELMLKANRYLIMGGALTEPQKANITTRLLEAKSGARSVESFKKSVNAPEYLRSIGQSDDTRVMYPLFYIPPYNGGKKLQTVIPMSPKTHILSANSYELEILRLLRLLSPDNAEAREMTEKTLDRLKTTCFAYNGCHSGECFHTALVTLRFLITASEERGWIEFLLDYYNKYSGETKRHSGTVWYYWLCLSELPFDAAKPELEKYKSEMIDRLQNRSLVMNSENDRTLHPVLLCVLRNCLSKYPEFEYIKNRRPYVGERDGRLRFDMSK